MANIQHLDMYSGEAKTFTLSGRDASNGVYSLTSKTVAWHVGRSPFRPDNSGALFSKVGSTVSASAGTFTVSVTLEDTQGIDGDYQHMAIGSDASGNRTVIVQGRFRIRPVIGT